MDGSLLVLLELLLILGLALGFGIREIVKTRRELRRDRAAAELRASAPHEDEGSKAAVDRSRE